MMMAVSTEAGRLCNWLVVFLFVPSSYVVLIGCKGRNRIDLGSKLGQISIGLDMEVFVGL